MSVPDATLALLVRAAEQGWVDFDALRAKAMERRNSTTSTIRGPGKRRATDPDEYEVDLDFPMEHTREQGTLLTSTSPAALSAWQAALTECARLRCSYAVDRVSEAALGPVGAAATLASVETVLDALLRTDDGPVDVPAVATVLGTLEPLLAALPDRKAALAWHDAWLPRLRPLDRCAREKTSTPACPECRRDACCPLDLWPRYLAPAAVGVLTVGSRKTFLHLSGADTGRGVLATWLGKDRRLLAEASGWLVHQQHRAGGNEVAAQTFARLAYVAGSREPRLMAAYANLLAAPGGETDLRRAVDACEEALLSRGGSTFEGWAELGAKRAQLLGRLERLRVRPSDQLDEDGIPSRPGGIIPRRPGVAALGGSRCQADHGCWTRLGAHGPRRGATHRGRKGRSTAVSPRRTWHGLSGKEQREVLRAARRRKEHPKPEIADAAYRWAQEVLHPEQRARDGAIGLLLSFIDGTLGGGWLGMGLAERRAAKRIVRARAAQE